MILKGIDIYSIDHIHGNILFSKDGTVSFLYWLQLPPKYSLSMQQYDERCYKLDQAFKNFPINSFVHRQEVYLKKPYNGKTIQRDSYLGRDAQSYFDGREFMYHESFVCYTLKGLTSLEKSYQSNPFSFRESLHRRDLDTLEQFDGHIQRSTNIINSLQGTDIRPVNEEEIKAYIRQYLNGFEETGFYDVDFRDKTYGGESHFHMLTINKSEYLPNKLTNVKKSELSSSYQPVYEGFMEKIGETLACNHIVNHIIEFAGKQHLITEIEAARKEYGNFRKQNETFDKRYRDLAKIFDHLNDTDDDLVLLHLNILLFDKDKNVLEKQVKELKSRLDVLQVSYYEPKKEMLQNVFLGSVFGREKLLHRDFFFLSDLLQAQLLSIHTSISVDDSKGIYFNNRTDQRPLRRKLWFEDDARNGLIAAATGGGKSVLGLTIMTQFLEEGINVVVAEFGRSFEFITHLYPDISKHIRLKADTPLGINPFQINKGESASVEKKGLLAQIVMKTWRVPEYMTNSHFIVSLERIIDHYYEETESGHGYEHFYNFVCDGGERMLYALDVESEYFDLKSFKHNCKQFIKGGKYENVFALEDSEISDVIREKQLVVFEMTEIAKDPFLVTLFLLVLQETIDTNILADRSKKGLLIFDEFSETADIRDMYTGEEVIQTVSVINQKIRKENSALYIIIQDFVQLPKNKYSESIIANTQLFFMLPSNRDGYQRAAQTLLLQDDERAQLQSIHKNFKAEYPYGELWMKRFEETEVVRNELPDASFLAFQTKGELWDKLNKDFQETGNLELSIEKLKHLRK
ncbi:MAG: hypothetical protein AAGH81_13340 [Bacteroidota bacterium]